MRFLVRTFHLVDWGGDYYRKFRTGALRALGLVPPSFGLREEREAWKRLEQMVAKAEAARTPSRRRE